ncbi:transposable element-related [Holotrichia oblita]|uniref:Transposable element-related n=1 Tax=Holotrichia oblita TaxID=644536 RepID=A0ACB9TJD1_HOLOL|nr:transposable element-related [Holotrichia oblita]
MPQRNQFEKVQIIIYLHEGLSVRNVAHTMHVNKTTVQRIRNKWETDETIGKRKPTGRLKITTEVEDNALVQYLEQNPFHVVRAAIQRTDVPGSRPTACRRIKESPLKNYVATKKMILGNEQKQARIICALNNILRENWDRVIFTDEKVFQSTNNGQIRVYRRRRTRFNENFVNNSERSGRFSVNVCGWLSYYGPGYVG